MLPTVSAGDVLLIEPANGEVVSEFSRYQLSGLRL